MQATGDTKRERRERQPLTRDRIVRAALEVMDAEGLEAVTMRRLGRELGVEAMSLYNHVADKDEILDGVIDLVMSDFRYPAPGGSWIDRARAASHEWRRLLKAHPGAITVLVERDSPLSTVAALRPMELALDILKEAGLTDHEAVQAFRAVGGYIMGHVLMEVGNIGPGSGHADVPPELEARAAELAGGELPRIMALLPELARCDNDETFEFGLKLILAGLGAKARGRRPSEPRSDAAR